VRLAAITPARTVLGTGIATLAFVGLALAITALVRPPGLALAILVALEAGRTLAALASTGIRAALLALAFRHAYAESQEIAHVSGRTTAAASAAAVGAALYVFALRLTQAASEIVTHESIRAIAAVAAATIFAAQLAHALRRAILTIVPDITAFPLDGLHRATRRCIRTAFHFDTLGQCPPLLLRSGRSLHPALTRALIVHGKTVPDALAQLLATHGHDALPILAGRTGRTKAATPATTVGAAFSAFTVGLTHLHTDSLDARRTHRAHTAVAPAPVGPAVLAAALGLAGRFALACRSTFQLGWTITAEPAAAILTALLALAHRYAGASAFLVQVAASDEKSEFETLAVRVPHPTGVEDTEIQLEGQIRRRFARAPEALLHADRFRLEAGKLHHALKGLPTVAGGSGYALTIITERALGTPPFDFPFAPLIAEKNGVAFASALARLAFPRPLRALPVQLLAFIEQSEFEALLTREPAATHLENAEEQLKYKVGRISEFRVALLEAARVGLAAFELHHAVEYVGALGGTHGNALTVVTLRSGRTLGQNAPTYSVIVADDNIVALALDLARLALPRLLLFTFPVLTEGPGRAFLRLAPPLFRPQAFNDSAFHARGLACRTYPGVALRIIAAMLIHRTLSTRYAGTTAIAAVLACTIRNAFLDALTGHAEHLFRTRHQVDPAGTVPGTNGRLVAHAALFARNALVLGAFVALQETPLVYQAIRVFKALHAGIGQFVAHHPDRATIQTGQNALTFHAFAALATVLVLNTVHADLFFGMTHLAFGTIVIRLALNQRHTGPLLAFLLFTAVVAGHALHTGVRERIASTVGAFFVGKTSLRDDNQIGLRRGVGDGCVLQTYIHHDARRPAAGAAVETQGDNSKGCRKQFLSKHCEPPGPFVWDLYEPWVLYESVIAFGKWVVFCPGQS